MTEYINREEIIEIIKNDLPNVVYYSKQNAIDCIMAIEAEDVAPLVHGKWIDKGWDGDHWWQIDGRGECWHVFGCSNCDYNLCASPKTNYCPN